MKRKIITQANQALTITLPIGWARENNLSKNSELDLKVVGKSLVINSDSPISGNSLKVNFNNLTSKNIYNQIVAFYSKGLDEIEIISEKDISSLITRCLNSTIGFALVSQSKDKFIIKDINPGNYPNLDEIFKRVFQMILLFYEAALKDIFGKQKETIESLKSRDREVNKFCVYLQRAINKMSYENQIKGRIIFTYSFELEKISDEIERLWRANIKYKIKKSDEIKKIVELSKEGLSLAFDLYYQFNSKKIDEIYAIRQKVRDKSLKLKKLDPSTTRFLRNAVKIVEEAADINHLALMKQL